MRRPFSMSQNEKVMWGFLNDKEKKEYWRHFAISWVGILLLLGGAIWLGLVNIDSVAVARRAGAIAGFGGLMLWFAYGSYARFLLERMLRMKTKLDFWEGARAKSDT